ncbi:hypothetical protein DV738_g4873, partial [Chaetothyriales sp. CBS 135597]
MYAVQPQRLTTHAQSILRPFRAKRCPRCQLLFAGYQSSIPGPVKDFNRSIVLSAPPLKFERIDTSYLVEEETLSRYNPKHYYPIKLGEILHERYRVIGKLGFGSASTVWLCRDLKGEHEYVALKVYINSSKYHRELPIYEEINNLQTAHEGQKYVRRLHLEKLGPNP